MLYILFGQIGSGKSVQAQKLSEYLAGRHLAMGPLLKERFAGHPLIKQGKLIPDDQVYGAVKGFLEGHAAKSIVLDGFPRNLQQYKWLEQTIENQPELAIQKAIFLNVDDQEIKNRLRGRKREDDTESAITERKRVFEKEVIPVINKYKSRDLLVDINGNNSVEAVYDDVVSAIV